MRFNCGYYGCNGFGSILQEILYTDERYVCGNVIEDIHVCALDVVTCITALCELVVLTFLRMRRFHLCANDIYIYKYTYLL